MVYLNELKSNYVLLCGISGWLTAQVLKTIIYAIMNKRLDLERMIGDGGMPSAHSATVTAMAVISFWIYGIGSFEFGISIMLAIIVMHDAMGVRLETGKQAKVLNEMMELIESLGNKELSSEKKLKEFVGHTPIQVICGFLLGVVNATAFYFIFIR